MKPLAGYRILSLAINIPGPVAAARLRDLGAEIIKIEPPTGDLLARASPDWYMRLHEGVAIRQIDLKSADGLEGTKELLADSDLFLTSIRPAALKRLGLHWPILGNVFPRLCQVAIVGYQPPDENKPGHDLTYQARLGLLRPPDLPRVVVADLAGAEWAVSAAMGLLLARERASANGQNLSLEDRYTRVSLADAAAAFALPLHQGLTAPGGLLGGLLPGYNLYRTQDGWVAVAALEPHFLHRLGTELGLVKLTHETLAEALQDRPSAAWESWAARHDLPLVAVND